MANSNWEALIIRLVHLARSDSSYHSETRKMRGLHLGNIGSYTCRQKDMLREREEERMGVSATHALSLSLTSGQFPFLRESHIHTNSDGNLTARNDHRIIDFVIN